MPSGRKMLLPALVLFMALSMLFLHAGCMSASVPATEETSLDQDPVEVREELREHITYIRQNTNNLASLIHDMINEEREKNDLGTLQWDRELASIALSHSKDMASREYFDHNSPEGDDFADRYQERGYSKQTRVGNQVYVGAENLFLNNVVESYTYDQESGEVREYRFNDLEELAQSTVQGWMDSPGHRENILTPFSREGIGIAVTDDGKVYITENFS